MKFFFIILFWILVFFPVLMSGQICQIWAFLYNKSMLRNILTTFGKILFFSCFCLYLAQKLKALKAYLGLPDCPHFSVFFHFLKKKYWFLKWYKQGLVYYCCTLHPPSLFWIIFVAFPLAFSSQCFSWEMWCTSLNRQIASAAPSGQKTNILLLKPGI